LEEKLIGREIVIKICIKGRDREKSGWFSFVQMAACAVRELENI
jgi:hypothetical protein